MLMWWENTGVIIRIFVHVTFPEMQILPKLQFVGCFSLFTSYLTGTIWVFFPKTHLQYQRNTYIFRGIFNVHKIKFCLKSTHKNTTNSPLKLFIVETEQSPDSHLYFLCHFFPLLRWHCVSLESRRSKQLLTSGGSCVVNYGNNCSCLGDFHIAWSFSCKFSRIARTWESRKEKHFWEEGSLWICKLSRMN